MRLQHSCVYRMWRPTDMCYVLLSHSSVVSIWSGLYGRTYQYTLVFPDTILVK